MDRKKGFTFIELVFVIVVSGVLIAAGVPFISSFVDAWLLNKAERDIIFNARLALNRMIREIRQIKNPDNITTFTDTEFNFTDINNNTIDFKQLGNSLLRNNDELTNKLNDTEGLNFTYLDSNGTVTTTKANIRMVRIRLNLVSGDSAMNIESLARFRNIN